MQAWIVRCALVAGFAAMVGISPVGSGVALAAETMSVGVMDNKTAEEQMVWANQQLGRYQETIHRAARNNRIPPRLLTAVILNELTDYDHVDVAQESIFTRTGTVGIAQTSVQNVLERDQMRGLISEREIQERMDRALAEEEEDAPDDAELRRQAIERLTWEKLNKPAIALEVCAREISRLMDRMSRNPQGNWAKHFLKGPIDRNNPYANIKPAHYPKTVRDAAAMARWETLQKRAGKLELRREQSLALAVIAAYNNERILDSTKEHRAVFQSPGKDATYKDAREHAVNGTELWATLLFLRKWPPQTEPRKILNLSGSWIVTITNSYATYKYQWDITGGNGQWAVAQTLRDTTHPFHKSMIGKRMHDYTLKATGGNTFSLRGEAADSNPGDPGHFVQTGSGKLVDGSLSGTATHKGSRITDTFKFSGARVVAKK